MFDTLPPAVRRCISEMWAPCMDVEHAVRWVLAQGMPEWQVMASLRRMDVAAHRADEVRSWGAHGQVAPERPAAGGQPCH